MNNTDLHMHTTASDGGYTPSQLVVKCHEVGLEYIAVTDHDTVGGVQEAIVEGKKHGITVIPGIEFSTKEQGKSVHILGYGIDITDKQFLKMLSEQQQLRKQRMEEMVFKFAKLNIHIDERAILKEADGGSIGRPHVAKVLVQMGIVKDVAEAFEHYLGEGKPCYVKKAKELTPEEAFEWIKKTRGVAIIAHPVYYELDEKIEEWVATGLLHGLEVYHRDHNEHVQNHYEKLTTHFEEKFSITLLRTGGSDFHHEDYGRVREPLGKTRIDNNYAHTLLRQIETMRT